MSELVAVLITSYNRAETTARCLERLGAQRLPDGVKLRTYLVDDASTDGTFELIRERFPDVLVARSSGDLYWTGGTLAAQAMASKDEPDHYLWLNDDVVLGLEGVRTLLETAEAFGNRAVIVGAVCNLSGQPTYGGRRLGKHSLDFVLVTPDAKPQCVHTMNGNVVLVPRRAHDLVGVLDQQLRHNMADLDFGLRASTKGIRIVQAPGVIGLCEHNTAKLSWRTRSLPLLKRVRMVVSIKGCPPRQWWRFTRRHGGSRWPLFFLSPYIHAVWPSRAKPEP